MPRTTALTNLDIVKYANAIAEHVPTFDERKHTAALALPRLGRDSLPMSPFMLRSALFSAAVSGPRARFGDYVDLPAHPGYRVEFQGEELRQDDRMVLLALVKARATQQTSQTKGLAAPLITASITFAPRQFCIENLGWPDSSDSPKKLAACLNRLQIARVRISGGKIGTQLYSFVSDASMPPGAWTVWLSERLAVMFSSNLTYLKHSIAAGVSGLDSWLYGYTAADECFAPISREHLRDLCGLTGYSQKEFNRRLNVSLDKLKDQNLIKDFAVIKGKLSITKK